jgi:hypothetical protein
MFDSKSAKAKLYNSPDQTASKSFTTIFKPRRQSCDLLCLHCCNWVRYAAQLSQFECQLTLFKLASSYHRESWNLAPNSTIELFRVWPVFSSDRFYNIGPRFCVDNTSEHRPIAWLMMKSETNSFGGNICCNDKWDEEKMTILLTKK